MTPVQRLAGLAVLVLVVVAGAFAGAWQVQDWRYGQIIANQAVVSGEEALSKARAAAQALKGEQDKREALEGRLKTNDEIHYREISDAKKAQQGLSDRLATADVRLSVLLATGAVGSGGGRMPAVAGAGSLDHGAARAELDPAHAQRIVRITGDGDEGLIALAACQGWVREVLSTGKALPP